MALALCVANYLVCRLSDWGQAERTPFSARRVPRAIWNARYGFGAPLVILGGIYGGFFTPTEAASVAVAYVMIVEIVLCREVSLRQLPDVFLSASRTTGMLGPIIAFSILFGEVLAVLHIPATIVSAFIGFDLGLAGAVAMIVVVLLIVGCILEPIAAILVVMPILFPIGRELGFDDIHFGVLVVCSLSVGFITPPVGINLFAASAVSGEPFEKIALKVFPSFLALLVAITVIATAPWLVLWYR